MLKANIVFKSKLPKRGNSVTECEDAFAYKSAKTVLTLAIADGATESSFAKEWATLLTTSLMDFKDFSIENLVSKLPALRKQWLLEATKVPLPWYAEAKLERGAFSTLLGVWLDLKTHQFQSMAIGDCCLFQIRNDALILTFPNWQADDFSNNPFLLSTKSIDDAELPNYIHEIKEQSLVAGDKILLMSDALAHWFVRECAKDTKPWHFLFGFSGEKGILIFEKWLNERRIAQNIKNDDTTLLVIDIANT
jgi:Protein phosphatase 2C